jgi:hypothetical protein
MLGSRVHERVLDIPDLATAERALDADSCEEDSILVGESDETTLSHRHHFHASRLV